MGILKNILVSAGINYALITGFIEGLKPQPKLTLREWSEANRVLPQKAAAEPGPYRMGRTPFLIKISDCLSNHSTYQKVVGIKGSQLGFSELGFNWMGYRADTVGGSFMYLMPTIDTMERNVKVRINPMIESTPSLQEKFGKARSKDSGNTLKQKDGIGVVWYLSGANSAASLASVPVRDAMLDEVDRYPGDVDGEGSPMALVGARQSTFGTRKKQFVISTPTIKGQSTIEDEFEKTDQHHYHVPCPHCNKLQILVWSQFRWVPGKYSVDDVHYECLHCKGKIYERHKTWMFAEANGATWIAHAPENSSPETIGFKLPSFYSPDGWLAWHQICRAWDESENDIPKRKTLVNTVFAESYEENSEAPEWQKLHENAQLRGVEPNKPMNSVAFIVAGVDVQADRLEVEIAGFMKGRITQQIDYRVLMGDVDGDEVWNKLTDLLNETFRRDDDATVPIRVMCIDTGYKSERVDDFAKKHGTQRVIPIKGSDSIQMPFTAPRVTRKTKQGKNIGKLKVWHVGVSYLKSQLYGWLRQTIDIETGEVPNGYCHFTKRDPQYFRGITAEVLQPVRNKKNHIVYQWIKKYERNEPLDCRIYCLAGAYIVGFDRWTDARWEKERLNMPVYVQPESKIATPKKKKNTPPGGSFWNRKDK